MSSKDNMERMCRAAGMTPESRETVPGDYELFLADGYSLPPHKNWRKFGVDPDEFPCGMYVTLWWISKQGTEMLNRGRPLFFDLFHSPSRSPEDKKRMRLEKARIDAKDFLKMQKKRQVHGIPS